MKPIIFSTNDVQALLNTKPGTWPAEPIDSSRPCKSQTRRVMKPQPEHRAEPDSDWHPGREYPLAFWVDNKRWIKPKYQVGYKLWVRETFGEKIVRDMEGEYTLAGYVFKAGYNNDWIFDLNGRKWQPSIHMPREAARLFLEVREVRAERLHSMKKEEVAKEGLSPNGEIPAVCCPTCKGTRWTEGIHCPDCRSTMVCFSRLWNAINGKGAWESNPWVWVYEFMRVEG